MEKYLYFLHADIEASIREARPNAGLALLLSFPDEEDEDDFGAFRFVTIPELTGIPSEAFPPGNLLTDAQVSSLTQAIERLWKAWVLSWEMPLKLALRKQYSAFVREMKNASFAYHPDRGGRVEICDYEGGKACPFQPDSYCFCKSVEEDVRQDIAIWEEHVRSQGIDPYRELSSEEERAFEEEMRLRDLRKRYGDDWRNYVSRNSWMELEDDDDFFGDDESGEWKSESGWDDDLLFRGNGSGGWESDDLLPGDEEDDDFEIPF